MEVKREDKVTLECSKILTDKGFYALFDGKNCLKHKNPPFSGIKSAFLGFFGN
jgi:hypothetical protein